MRMEELRDRETGRIGRGSEKKERGREFKCGERRGRGCANEHGLTERAQQIEEH